MNAYDIIRDAILNKRQIVATYQGCRREMCPHALGMKKGRYRVLFFQFAGESNSGLPQGGQWRCINLDELERISVREGPWHTGSRTTSRRQFCIDDVHVEAAY
jgi:hypothetical protein